MRHARRSLQCLCMNSSLSCVVARTAQWRARVEVIVYEILVTAKATHDAGMRNDLSGNRPENS
jgi:hypothetical protein